MPWMALVPDISGVCSVLGTFEITANPTNPGQHQDRQVGEKFVIHPVHLGVLPRLARDA